MLERFDDLDVEHRAGRERAVDVNGTILSGAAGAARAIGLRRSFDHHVETLAHHRSEILLRDPLLQLLQDIEAMESLFGRNLVFDVERLRADALAVREREHALETNALEKAQ